MKNIRVINLVLIFILIIFFISSCSMDYGLEDSQKELNKNKNELLKIVELLNLNYNLLAISRKDYHQVFLGRYIKFIKDIDIEYFIISNKNEIVKNFIRFKVVGSELEFFKNDYKNIKTQEDNLFDYLNRNEISIDIFNLLKDFLIRYNFFEISKSSTDEAILFYLSPGDGLMYSIKPNIEQNNPRYKEIINLENGWYYFKTLAM